MASSVVPCLVILSDFFKKIIIFSFIYFLSFYPTKPLHINYGFQFCVFMGFLSIRTNGPLCLYMPTFISWPLFHLFVCFVLLVFALSDITLFYFYPSEAC